MLTSGIKLLCNSLPSLFHLQVPTKTRCCAYLPVDNTSTRARAATYSAIPCSLVYQ